ncbi:lysozyme inhibitor LprI family protein [Flavobacterium sp. FBOR7N2.3]|uniref:Lysozyme inhibitor LprI family protein n=1 Tax=Flavobacterium magnesitis TaxID=3138077 RepID=A0ABV4TJX0_9FLAO
MNKIFLLLLLIFSLNCFSQTQAEMNQEAYASYDKADKKLNTVYQKILVKYKTDKLFVTNLKKSQRIWISFRDAEMNMKYPNYPKQNYGSIYPTCRAVYLTELTENRIKTLTTWLNGINEGDTCAGSVKTN